MPTATTSRPRTRKVAPPDPTPPTPVVPLAPVSRNISSVTVSLGVVSFSAGLHGAVADQSDPLVTVCNQDHDAVKIKQVSQCPVCEATTGFLKGQMVGDTATVLTQEQVDAIKAGNEAAKGTLDLRMVREDKTYMVPAGSTYYLTAKTPGDARNYTLIAGVVRKRPELAFLAELSFRGGAPHLYRLGVTDDGVLVAREIARPEAVRARPQVVQAVVDPAMEQLVEQLVDASTKAFDPTAFANPHIARVAAALSEARPVVAAGVAPAAAGAGDGDIMAALQASLASLGAAPAAETKRSRKVTKAA